MATPYTGRITNFLELCKQKNNTNVDVIVRVLNEFSTTTQQELLTWLNNDMSVGSDLKKELNEIYNVCDSASDSDSDSGDSSDGLIIKKKFFLTKKNE